MKQTAVINFKCVLLIFLLTFDCNAQVSYCASLITSFGFVLTA